MAFSWKKHLWQSLLLALVGPLLGSVFLIINFPGMAVLALFWPLFLLATYYIGFPPSFATSLYLLYAARAMRPSIAITSTAAAGAVFTAAWVGWNFGLEKDMSVVAIGCGSGSALICAVLVVAAKRRPAQLAGS